MNAENDYQDDEQPDELTLLKARADDMGIKYSHKIGVDALRDKIKTALTGSTEDTDEDEDTDDTPVKETDIQRRTRLRAEQLRLIRCRITNLNPQKRELHGEIFTTGNRILGAVRKYIPYGDDAAESYHVPFIIFNQLKNRKFLDIRTKRVGGQIKVSTRWSPEFSIEELPPLTPEELKDLATAQAASGSIDSGNFE